jgi:hypothetical protein
MQVFRPVTEENIIVSAEELGIGDHFLLWRRHFLHPRGGVIVIFQM